MLRGKRVTAAGSFAFALCVWGLSAGGAADEANQHNLLPDANPPVPSFALPSDNNLEDLRAYLYRTDPTGQVVDNVPSPTLPTEKAGQTDVHFLTYGLGGTRLDTTESACDYYVALSAITGVVSCGPHGALQGSDIVTFDKWKHDVAIDKYAPDGKTIVAHFINLVDLNLTRNHHMISYGSDQLAAYVCNHSGPAKTAADPTGLFPPQGEVDQLIRSIKSKASLIACVAMEYSTRGQPSGTLPFTKFFIFNGDGKLLSTVDLDGRGPKGVPNVCTACHGGPFDYNVAKPGETTVHFDSTHATSRPTGDLGAHFLPFDKANFAFSSKRSQAEQEDVIFRLNLAVYTTEISRVKIGPDGFISPGGLASASITDLISGWYNGQLVENNPAPGFNTSNVPIFWDYYGYNDIYLRSYAHNCRTCHVAMENVPLEREPQAIKFPPGDSPVCDTHTMPNAKITFDRFWLSDPFWTFPPVDVPGQPASTPNQPDLLNEITACPSFNNP